MSTLDPIADLKYEGTELWYKEKDNNDAIKKKQPQKTGVFCVYNLNFACMLQQKSFVRSVKFKS